MALENALPTTLRVNWLQHPNPEVRTMAAQLQEHLLGIRNRQDPMAAVRAIAQIITPMILDYLTIEDIWAQIFDFYDWTTTRPVDHAFRLPPEVQGYKEVLSYQNGATLPVATVARKFIGVLPEDIATPEFPYDTGELERPDAIVSIQDMEEIATRMIEIYKARTGYLLLGDGFDDSLSDPPTVDVVIDDGSYIPNGMLLQYIITLRDKIEEHVYEMQNTMGGHPQIGILARQITFDRLYRSGLFGRPGTLDPRIDETRTDPALKPIIMPAGTDNIDQWAVKASTSRPLFTEGDIFLLGPRIGAYALTRTLDPSTVVRDHWTAAIAWRLAYAWVRWIDKGDLSRIRRVLFIKEVAAGGVQGHIEFDGLYSGGADFYCSRPLKKSTIDNTTVVISASSNGSAATGSLTTKLKGDLRHFHVTFGSALTPGTTYYVRTTTGVKDLAGDDVSAFSEIQVVCGG